MMRKRNGLLFLAALSLLLTGCGSKAVNALEYVELGQYKGLEVSRMDTAISEEELQKQVDKLLSSYATKEPVTDRTDVQLHDIANIDYEGTMDGVAFSGGSAKGYDLEIGSGTFIDGFEDGLIGANVGDTLDVTVTFPEDYPNNQSLAGKPAVFRVTVNSISKNVLPELTEDFIREKTSGQFGSVDEMKNYLREQTASSLNSYADSTMYTQLLSMAVENAKLIKDIPEEYLEEKREAMIRTAKSNAEAYGKTYEEYLQNYLKMDEATFLDTIAKSATEIAKQSLVISAIAQTENITVTDEEYEKKVADTMAEYGYEKEKDLFQTVTEQDIRDTMLLEKVQEFLADQAVITVQ